MIRINLLGETKDDTAWHILQLIIFGVALFISVVACFMINNSVTHQVTSAETQKTLLEGQLAKLQKKTKKVDELEKNKKFLAEKLTTIANLKAKRQGPVQLLDSITQSIPSRAWLTNLSQKGQVVEFEGLAVDPQTVSMFMRELESSAYFNAVDLTYSRLSLRDDVKLQQFAVIGQLEDAIKLQKKLSGEDIGSESEDLAEKN